MSVIVFVLCVREREAKKLRRARERELLLYRLTEDEDDVVEGTQESGGATGEAANPPLHHSLPRCN